MEECGFSLDGQHSKALDRYLYQQIDLVVTVCDGAKEACPVFPRAGSRLHWPIDDPSGVRGDEGLRLEAFRRARDELRTRIETELLTEAPAGA